MGGVMRTSGGATVEGLNIVQVDSPEVRKKYEMMLEKAKVEHAQILRDKDAETKKVKHDLERASQDYAKWFKEARRLQDQIGNSEAEKLLNEQRRTNTQLHQELKNAVTQLKRIEQENMIAAQSMMTAVEKPAPQENYEMPHAIDTSDMLPAAYDGPIYVVGYAAAAIVGGLITLGIFRLFGLIHFG